MSYSLNEIIQSAMQRRASDIHIRCGVPIKLRVDGTLQNLDEVIMTAENCESYAIELLNGRDKLGDIGECDLSRGFENDIRCRVNVFKERGCYAIAIRILNNNIPSFKDLGLPSAVNDLLKAKRGLVLVTGQTGSGKSTTLAYMINEINKNQSCHIVTFEDPIEYVHSPIKSMISQREVGFDTRSFQDGLNAVLREDPDVIMIGELRTLNEIEAALTIAETGHLVLASLHTNSAAETIDRIVDVFPAQQQAQIRMQLSMTLNGVICQQLIPHICGKGRVLATEVMMVNGAIRNLIREGLTPQINNVIATTADIGNHLMDSSILALYRRSVISREDALRTAHFTDNVRKSVM